MFFLLYEFIGVICFGCFIGLVVKVKKYWYILLKGCVLKVVCIFIGNVLYVVGILL